MRADGSTSDDGVGDRRLLTNPGLAGLGQCSALGGQGGRRRLQLIMFVLLLLFANRMLARDASNSARLFDWLAGIDSAGGQLKALCQLRRRFRHEAS